MPVPSLERIPFPSAEIAEPTEGTPEETRRDLGVRSLRLAMDHASVQPEEDGAKQTPQEKVARLTSSPWVVGGEQSHSITPTPSPEGVARKFAHYKISPNDAASLIEQAEVMQPVARVAIRQSIENLAKIVHDGRFKSVLETSTSAGIDDSRVDINRYKDFRRQFEATQFDQTADEPAVIYGFMDYTNEDRGDTINMPVYGRVQFTLKPEVAARATFSEDDSLQAYGTSREKEQFLGFNDAVIMQQAVELAKQRGEPTAGQYVESQVHGGVDLYDVESVEVTLDPEDLQGYIGTLEQLQATYPTIKVTVNLDYSNSGDLPATIISSHPGIDFHPIVTTKHTVFERERMTTNRSIQAEHQESTDRVELLRESASEIWHEETGTEMPTNFKAPKMMNLMNGDRLTK